MFELLALKVKAIILAATVALSATTGVSLPTPSPSLNPQSVNNLPAVIQFEGNKSYLGQTATYHASFPKNGGPIEGTFSGSCSGTIHGTYTAQSQTMEGVLKGKCATPLYTGPIQQAFTGKLMAKEHSVQADLSAGSLSISVVQEYK